MQTKRKLLNSQEAADYLGFSLSYFRKMMMRRVIPMYKPSGKICFFDPDILAGRNRRRSRPLSREQEASLTLTNQIIKDYADRHNNHAGRKDR